MKTLTAACAATLVALAACAPKAEKTVAAIDPKAPPTDQTRGPGSQTLDQMLERSRARFAGADLNGDGKVTAGELDQVRARRDAAGAGPRRGGMLMRADADGDGAVTLAEAETQGRERFVRLDADQDGLVSRDERRSGLRPPS
ncbi:EF-hand domain-containing protein [Phenylobacterium sp.]|uniref:EF-hand domain-containing protein n=1 Tax=Phenylobacterium sp. TaxID=1871053 RepID=UPI0027191B29|nr:hypothetical protein [Phenylobacterium sp.]MDO8378228.1 hypothetical protein [Phenylobacterium sp.]